MDSYRFLFLEDEYNPLTVGMLNLSLAKAKEIAITFKGQIKFSNLKEVMLLVQNFYKKIFSILSYFSNIAHLLFSLFLLLLFFVNPIFFITHMIATILFKMVVVFLEKKLVISSKRKIIEKWEDIEKKKKSTNVYKRKTFIKNIFLLSTLFAIVLLLFFKLKTTKKELFNLLSIKGENPLERGKIFLFLSICVLSPITTGLDFLSFFSFVKKHAVPFFSIFKEEKLPTAFTNGIFSAYTIVKHKFIEIFKKINIKFVFIREKNAFINMGVINTSSTLYLLLIDDLNNSLINSFSKQEIESIYLHEFGHFLYAYANNVNIFTSFYKLLFEQVLAPLIFIYFSMYGVFLYKWISTLWKSWFSIKEEMIADTFALLNSTQKDSLRSALTKIERLSLKKMKEIQNEADSFKNLHFVKKLFEEATHPSASVREKYLLQLEKILKNS